MEVRVGSESRVVPPLIQRSSQFILEHKYVEGLVRQSSVMFRKDIEAIVNMVS